MADQKQLKASTGLTRNFRDNADGTFAEEFSSATRYWDTNTLAWVKGTQPTGGGGGGPVTVADGADVAQGTTTDAASANTLVGLLKAIKAAAQGTTAGGLDVFRTLDADETEEDVKTSAGQLYGWHLFNDGAAEVYVKLYNATAAVVVVGSTTPRMTVPIPAGSAANVEFTHGIVFDTAICIAATTGVSDADTGAPAANQVIANIFFK